MQRGFTLVELLVVIAIIGVLVALLLPAVQAAREAARRMSCSNNVKNIVLAMHNYAEANKQFPIGARASQGNYGQSWTIGLLPYIEQDALYQLWNHNVQWSTNAVHVTNPQPLMLNIYRCPSSPLQKFVNAVSPSQAKVMQVNYVGISGCTNSADSSNSGGFSAVFSAAGRVTPTTSGAQNIVSSNGVLHPDSQTSFGDLTKDGTSNTMFIGEQGDFMRRTNASGQQCEATNSYPNGGFAGVNTVGVPGASGYSLPAATHAITTIRNPINYKISNASNGTAEGGGLNCGIFAAHGGGCMVGWGDGRVSFVSENLDMTTLFRISSREDGLPVQLPDR
jgi:prepilin-type N-terminal cleavage/methylation domain-containing protein/prepilin-type processing-associated H-X9-DG protein